ncbi:thiopeptide-type bacteriocin biosynthesis protein [Mucilaginibacter sabulilitoris]|uniref:Thiopeptide-type bacteriocin biosynthesis protein n=1 Tax=Mucilaginibacter sabulilitoris TaxID=1173583 RepID=A0ABZ0TTF0_9SPHI|nr:thiopeptide-type bacteriocin biosynthesis protein [Mucilaginibacter sabulilitoris]WPU95752.1 thiopeptide-type bacteriocin biosynthesis protein [Mucilaginibacter sabulilitoris]
MVNPEHIEFLDKVFVRTPYLESSAYKVGKLRDVLKTNVFKNAIWLASTEFYNELAKKNFDFELLTKKEQLTALKFYNRMSFRGTPFGVFSSFGLADWNADQRKQYADSKQPILHLLPAVQFEQQHLQSDSLTADTLIAINPTLYQLSSGWRYSRYEEDQKGKLLFSVYLLEYDPADELLLAYLQEKPLPLNELSSYLIELTDCTRDEATDHMARLVNEQVLITINALSLLKGKWLNKYCTVPYDQDLNLPEFVSATDPDLPKPDDGKLLYAGMEMEESASLSAEWQQEIMEALKALDLLAPVPPKNNLDKFREAFELKFGERHVPLLEALDPDLGVLFDEEQPTDEHELIKGLEFKQEPKVNDQIIWSPVHRLLMKVWLQNSRRTEWESVALTMNDISGLPGNNLQFPPSTSVFCALGENKIVFQNIGGATANALTGRFSAFSDDFDAFCKATAKQESEANPTVLFAEIEQLSHRKIDNINRRRQIYEHVIPLNVFPAESAILPRDIDVLVRRNEIVLIHRPTGKRIVPRLPTAFNYHHNEMPLFRFLCALQYKSIRANFDFDPEKIFPGLNFYPRIAYGRCVISLARWYVSEVDIKMLMQRPLSISRLHLFCRERGIPPMISVGRGDQQLFFDLSNDEEAIFFLEALNDQSKTVVTEFIAPDDSQAKKGGRHNSQFIVSLRNTQFVYQPVAAVVQSGSTIRDFQPGSEWVYLKIYATYQSMERILSETLIPWAIRNRDRLKQWFFIRYYDTGSHLRFRVKVDLAIVKDVQFDLQSIFSPLMASGMIQKTYFDTYQREIERYSARLMEDVEWAFFKGSALVGIRIIAKTNGREDDLVWPIVHCFRIVSIFFENDLEQISQLCEWVAAAFFNEHGSGKNLKRSMDDRYRELRPDLLKAMESAIDDDYLEFDTAIRLLSKKSVDLSSLARQRLIADIIHMEINRIFISEQRMHEAFIWHCLSKKVVTQLKRQLQVDVTFISGR